MTKWSHGDGWTVLQYSTDGNEGERVTVFWPEKNKSG